MQEQNTNPSPEQIPIVRQEQISSPAQNSSLEKTRQEKGQLLQRLTDSLRVRIDTKILSPKQPTEEHFLHTQAEKLPSNTLDDLRRVGADKPLGYLTLDIIRERWKENPVKLQQEALDKGLLVKLFAATPDNPASLYVADREALRAVLQKHAPFLRSVGWPTEPERFIDQVAEVDAPPKTKLFDIIADAFADYTNIGRLDVRDEEADAEFLPPFKRLFRTFIGLPKKSKHFLELLMRLIKNSVNS